MRRERERVRGRGERGEGRGERGEGGEGVLTNSQRDKTKDSNRSDDITRHCQQHY